MKISIETLRDSFKQGYDSYEDSYKEFKMVQDAAANRYYSDSNLLELQSRGQPAETYNIVNMMDRALLGYFSTVIDSIKTYPLEPENTGLSDRINKVLEYTLKRNDFPLKKEDILLNSIHAGVVITHINVLDTGRTDNYGRKERFISLDVIDPATCVFDPKSKAYDYRDARYVHTFKWLSEAEAKAVAGRQFSKLVESGNELNIDEAELYYIYGEKFDDNYVVDKEYLIVHSQIKDDDGVFWSVLWSGNTIISKEKIPYHNNVLPYRIIKIHQSRIPEFYGIYRDVLPSIQAINQAILQIQLLANTKKVMVQKGSLSEEELEEFKAKFFKINSILEVTALDGIRVEDVTADIVKQYTIIEKGLERIQLVLHINPSFLGAAAKEESGRKVNIQKTSAIVALRYIVTRLEYLYKIVGTDIVNLMNQYYNSEMSIPGEDSGGEKTFNKVNSPLRLPTPETQEGEVIKDYEYNEETQNYEEEIINDPDTDLSFDRLGIDVEAYNYDDAAEADRLMLESIVQGSVGQFVMQADPVEFLNIAALSVKQKKVRHSKEIAEALLRVAKKLGGAPTVDPRQQGELQQSMQGMIPGNNISNISHTMGLSNEVIHPAERVRK